MLQHNHIPALPICKVTLKAKKPISKAYPVVLNTIGDHIRKLRVELKLFQKDVAKILGVKKDPTAIGRIPS
ncbi:MAG: hypothetical protein ACYC49_13440 [Ignavibacteriaceae bacterium]